MGIRFVARLAHAKARIIPAGMPPDSTFTEASPRIGEGFRARRLRLGTQKKGHSQGERPGEEILLLLLCFVPQCDTAQESPIRQAMSTVNYTLIVNIS